MVLDACNNAISKAIGRDLDEKEKKLLNARAAELVKKIQMAKDDPLAVQNVLGNFADDIKAMSVIQRRNSALNFYTRTKQTLRRQSIPFMMKNPASAFRGLIRGSLFNYEGAKNGLGPLIDRESDFRVSDFIAELQNAKLADYAFSGADDRNIGLAVHGLRNGADEGTLLSQFGRNAVTVAKAMEKHLEKLRIDLNRSGAWISRNDDYIAKQTHNDYKLATSGGNAYGSNESFEHWFNEIGPKMDWSKSFDGDLINADAATKRQTMYSLWQDFISNYHYRFKDHTSSFASGFQNIARRYSQQRQIVFDKPESFLDYHAKYGQEESLAGTYWKSLAHGGRDLAIMREWGPNALQNISTFVDKWEADLKKSGRAGDGAALRTEFERFKQDDWKVMTDQAGSPGSSQAARYVQAARLTILMSHIGKSIFAAFGDLPLRAGYLRYAGDGRFFQNLLGETMHMVDGMGLSKEERSSLAAEAGIRMENMLMPVGANEMNEIGLGSYAKFIQRVSKYGGHSWWSNRIRTNTIVGDAFRHFQQAGKSYAALPEGMRRVMGQFGITDKGWDIMRKLPGEEIGRGYKIFTPSAIEELPLENFKSLVADKEPSQTQLLRARTELYRSYRNMLGESAERTTSRPSRTIRAATNWFSGADPDSASAELARGFNMLKGFTYNYMRNHLGRELMGYEPDHVGWGKALWKTATFQNRAGAMGLLKLVSASIGYGYISNTMSDLADGKTPENPVGEHWKDAMMRAMARQSLGLYSDFLLGNATSGGRDESMWEQLGSSLAGPELGAVVDIGDWTTKFVKDLAKPDGMSENDFNKLTQRGFSTIYRNTPYNNLFWTKWASDYFILHGISELLNPGYTQRLEQRAQQERGQQYIMGASPASNQ